MKQETFEKISDHNKEYPTPCSYGVIVDGGVGYCLHEEGPMYCKIIGSNLLWEKKSCDLFEEETCF